MDDQRSKSIKTLYQKIRQGCPQIAMSIASHKEISSEVTRIPITDQGMQAKLAVYDHGLSEADSKLNKCKDLIQECAKWEDMSIKDLLESQNYKKCVKLQKSIHVDWETFFELHHNVKNRTNDFQNITTDSSRGNRIYVSLKPEPLEVNNSLIEFKNWMKAFRRFYSSNLMSKLALDEQQGYLDNCLSFSCRGNLEQFLDMGDIESIDACLDSLNGNYQ
ncbi:unnamed protein product [Lepeophtheirus salmonis]|uniref:(salmon louse) hypothetical protein n=1 Tax=Lepeophtheirus salmonis TaxID=72036 RepID=A0A7R8CP53_LEPSM|nr:unnamed protein product [Lepeophtheirus salmonis]CAF2878213.1 unnamed protein product [Lepeophtheirus salmonis]